LLSLSGVTKSYNKVNVLSGVELNLGRGQIAALVGPSGSGKSTLLHLIAGLLKPDSGTISWGGRILYDSHINVPPWKRRVGLVFQDLALWPHLSVMDHLNYVCEANPHVSKGMRKEYILSILEKIQLAEVGHRFPHQLSGGQQQRLAIARVLIMSPEIVLFDEALNQLDQELAKNIWDTVIYYQKKLNWTLLYVTHDIKHAEQQADYIFKIDAGKVVNKIMAVD